MTGSKFALKLRKHNNPITFDVRLSPVFVKPGDYMVIETSRGEEYGLVQRMPLFCNKSGLREEIKILHIHRLATEQDKQQYAALPNLEQEYLQKANQVFESKTDEAKVIACELLFSKKKIFVYYRLLQDEEPHKGGKKHPQQQQRQHRFNSKEVHKELFAVLNMQVELKEMGNRASAYVIGGVGHCGCGLCCTTFLDKPRQVSVKMAKEQSLAINIPKLSGVCGKLMCCISYENTQYERGVLQCGAARPTEDKDLLAAFERKKPV